MKKILFGLAVAAALIAAGVWMSMPESLVLGTAGDFAPFAAPEEGEGSEIVGFDVEIAQAIAAQAGLKLKIKAMEFNRLLPALADGKVDMVISGLSITDERRRLVDFSVPYYKATQVVLIRKGDPVPSAKDELKGRKIGAQLGTTGANAALEITGAENVRTAVTPLGAVVDLMNSQVDFVILDEQPAVVFEKKNPELQLVPLGFEEEFYGIAVQRGDAARLDTINRTLAGIVADGRYEWFVDRWMVQMK